MRDARSYLILCIFVASAAAAPACGSSSTGDSNGTGGTGNSAASMNGGNAGTAGSGATAGAGGAAGAAGAAGSAGSGVIVEAPCAGHTYECGDTVDNDNDGLIDSQDPDCLGACDNTEGNFYGGIPGQAGPACQVDCYWDSNSGPGNDDCYWNHQCDPNEEKDPGHPEPNSSCPYDPDAKTPGTSSSCDQLLMKQSQTCATVCGPLTPNGCDCFGCCELPAGSGKFVWLGSEDEATGEGSCSIKDLADPTKCEPCIPVPSCYNDCGKCELCIGKGPEDLPPECNPGSGGAGGAGGMGGTGGAGGGSTQCPAGVQPCGVEGQAMCGAGYYCVTGCCQKIEEPK